jgi:hypothetical protein
MKIQDLKEGCAHGEYYCSTDKKWKCRQGPKQTRATEAANTAQQAAIAIAKKKKQGVAEGELDEAKIASTEEAEDFFRNGKKVGSITKVTLKSGIIFYRVQAGNSYKIGADTQQEALRDLKKLLRDRQGVAEEKTRLDAKCWDGYKKDGTKMKGDTRVNNCVKEELEETYDGDEFFEAYGELWFNEDEQLDEAEYQGRSVPLGKPMQGDVKKFKVYVKDPSTGNVKKVNFGDPDMKIRKSNPAARRSFRARHNCDNPGPRTKARYWSCRKW